MVAKKDDIIYARVQSKLRAALERRRIRMSLTAGVEIKTSAVIRSILEQELLSKKSRRATEAA